ncbi:SDR family NAD(P)-dependent oxidoreductase [Sphingomonas sp.]|uniref:SDR family NAD(P)-dependent oxidoreductase n=1 Tax=Sphingomonas sp. TaxID=28214 RepID=UPI003D6CEDA6
MGKLSGKIAVVTGGASGIGLATARLFQAEGATVAIFDRNPAALEAVRAEFNDNALTVAVDVARPAEVELALAQVSAAYGRIDILFANAGVSHCPPLFETDEASFDAIVGVNIKGVFFCFTRAMPYFSDGASAIFTSSVIAERGQPGDALYGATKAAVRSMARTFAADDDVKAKKIRVNAVSPGPIQTPMTREATDIPEVNAYIESLVPLGRWGKPEEVAKAVLFLASDDASYLTGGVIAVDGGLGQV